MNDELDPSRGSDPAVRAPDGAAGSGAGTGAGRPMIERIGMALVALVLAVLFGGIALAAFAGGEPFLGAMAAIGAGMTLWVGAVTLVRG